MKICDFNGQFLRSHIQGRSKSVNWGGGVHSHIRVMPDEFLFKSVVF